MNNGLSLWVVKQSENNRDGRMDNEVLGIFESFNDAESFSQKELDNDTGLCVYVDEHHLIKSKTTVHSECLRGKEQ